MNYTKEIGKIPAITRSSVELIDDGDGLLPKSMVPSVSTKLQGIYEVVELTGERVDKTVLRKTNKTLHIPPKVYGDLYKWTYLVLSSYSTVGKSSLMAYGKKGNGKSLLTDIIAMTASEKFNLPIILVGRLSEGQALVSILRHIGPCILYIDEFTKMLSYMAQEELLSYLSGSDSKGSIVLITTNDINNLSEYIKHRPDRIRYQVYRGNVEEDTIREYCAEKLDDKKHLDNIIKISANSGAFNMDSLMAVVDELNLRHNSKLSFDEIVGTLNIAVKSGPAYVVSNIEFKDDGIKYANVELTPQNYGRFEFKLLITMKSGVVAGQGHFSKIEHQGFENAMHKYGVVIRISSGEIRSLDAVFYIKELSPNMGDGTTPL